VNRLEIGVLAFKVYWFFSPILIVLLALVLSGNFPIKEYGEVEMSWEIMLMSGMLLFGNFLVLEKFERVVGLEKRGEEDECNEDRNNES